MTTEGAAGAWAAEQLTAYLAALSRTSDRGQIVQRGVDLAAESLEAEVAALVEQGEIVGATGFPAGRLPADELRRLATQREAAVDLPGIGPCQVLVAPYDAPESGALLVARVDTGPFSAEERNLLRGMSRVLGLSLRAAQTLAAERSLRSRSDRQATEIAELLRSAQERQVLLERLTRIQRSMTAGRPLEEVLRAIVTGAAELLRCDVVTLRRRSDDDPDLLVMQASEGLAPDSPIRAPMPVGSGASGQAMRSNRLVVLHDYPMHEAALPTHSAAGISAAMAAPVHENGAVVGSLVVAGCEPNRVFTAAEQEMLLSFADHASLAMTDARTSESLRRALHTARHDAMHDVLTGLPNRALLRDRLDQAARRRARTSAPLALLFLDLDNFKHVNDSLGHDAGDQLLVAVAARLGESLRPSDTIARLGGDEFAILVEELDHIDDVDALADRLLDALMRPVTLAGRSVDVGASVGIATWDGGTDTRTLLRNADLAMYEAKRSGGGRAVRFAPDMHHRTLQRLDIEHGLRDAVATDQLLVHYQPIIDLPTGRICAAEALLRWQHPTRGLVSPAEFIPVAESSRLIHAVGETVLRQACRDAAAWPDDVGVTVNLSPRQVATDLPGRVAAILAETGLAPQRLTLELTEGAVMVDTPETVGVLDDLHGLGVHLAIDDFGTGYSSLTRLRQLPVDTVKIDQVFVADLGTDAGAAIVGAVIGLGRAAGLSVVAEGVETEEQLAVLRGLGCDGVQGYLLGRPGENALIVARLQTQVDDARAVEGSAAVHAQGEPGAGPGSPAFPADVLVFRRVGVDRFAHIGGSGRGSGWAGIVDVGVTSDDGPTAAVTARLGVHRRRSENPVQVVGPYWSRDAVIATIDDNTFVVLADPVEPVTALLDRYLMTLARRHAEAVVAAPPAKRLADELEVLDAVRLVAATSARTIEEALWHVAAVAGDALSCELAAVVSDDGRHAVVRRGVELAAPDDQIAAVVRRAGHGVVDALCAQNAVVRGLPAPLTGANGIASWTIVRIKGEVPGVLFAAHTMANPRGFTNLCRRLAGDLARAAEAPLRVARLHESVVAPAMEPAVPSPRTPAPDLSAPLPG